jgi:hypothetical protein
MVADQVAERIGLHAIGEQPQEQVLGKVRRCLAAGERLPARLQASQIEIAPARDLLLEGSCLAGIEKASCFLPIGSSRGGGGDAVSGGSICPGRALDGASSLAQPVKAARVV